MFIRDRIRELRRVLARQLRPSPKNWRSHPPAQRDALQGLLAELGYCDALLVRELADGALELIDGHLRAETTPDVEVPVLVLDVTAEEAAGGDSTVLVWDLSGHYRDGRFIPVKRTQAEMNSLWVDLAEDSARAFRAVEALAATTPEQVVPFLKDDLRPEAAAEPRQVAGWIRQLDSDEFEVREDASRHLEKQGLAAVAALRQALAADPSPEVQRRLKKLL